MDVERLITHLRYGTPYHGDVQRDTLDALERLGEAEALADVRTESLEEALTQFPEEDFLQDVLADLKAAKGMLKADMVEAIEHAAEELERIQSEVARAAEYARSLS